MINFNSYIGDYPTTQEANTVDKAVNGDPAERNLKLWIGVTLQSDRKKPIEKFVKRRVFFVKKKKPARILSILKTFVSK